MGPTTFGLKLMPYEHHFIFRSLDSDPSVKPLDPKNLLEQKDRVIFGVSLVLNPSVNPLIDANLLIASMKVLIKGYSLVQFYLNLN